MTPNTETARISRISRKDRNGSINWINPKFMSKSVYMFAQLCTCLVYMFGVNYVHVWCTCFQIWCTCLMYMFAVHVWCTCLVGVVHVSTQICIILKENWVILIFVYMFVVHVWQIILYMFGRSCTCLMYMFDVHVWCTCLMYVIWNTTFQNRFAKRQIPAIAPSRGIIDYSKITKINYLIALYSWQTPLFSCFWSWRFFESGALDWVQNADFSSYIFFKMVQNADNRHFFCLWDQIG